MSDMPERQLSELTAALVHALRLGLGLLDERDPLRRKIVDAVLTAQMRDPRAVARLADFLNTDADPNPPGVALTHADRMERLQLVPKINPPMRVDVPRDSDLAAAVAAAAGGGGHISTDPLRTNVRPFLAAANVVHARTLHHPPTPSTTVQPSTIATDVDISDRCDGLRCSCCNQMEGVREAVDAPLVDDGSRPTGPAGQLQPSTIATDVDWCSCTGDSPTRRHPRGEPGCQHLAAPTDSIDDAGIPHKSHYAVSGHPSGPLMPCSVCGSAIGTNLGCQACTADVDARLQAQQQPTGRMRWEKDAGGWVPAETDHASDYQQAVEGPPERIPALPDGDTREWPDDALHGTARLS